MTYQTHSPAPWIVSDSPGNCDDTIYAANGAPVARLICAPIPANGRLLRAAPELLASLQELENAIRFHFLPLVEQYAGTPAAHAKDEAVARAVAAIKRATQD